MPCTDTLKNPMPIKGRRWQPAIPLLAALVCAGCGQPANRAPVESRPAAAGSVTDAAPRPAPAPGPAAAPAGPGKAPAWRPTRHWDDYRRQAAQRVVAVNSASTYLGAVPEPLLAIPVLEVELNGDGSVRRIQVMRRPGQALDTVQLAIDAVQRAAPFGPVSHLPRPWKFSETFLFDEQRRFKPRSLDD